MLMLLKQWNTLHKYKAIILSKMQLKYVKSVLFKMT